MQERQAFLQTAAQQALTATNIRLAEVHQGEKVYQSTRMSYTPIDSESSPSLQSRARVVLLVERDNDKDPRRRVSRARSLACIMERVVVFMHRDENTRTAEFA